MKSYCCYKLEIKSIVEPLKINRVYIVSVKDPKFREESSSYSITGTIVNNSTQEISQISAYAILYDKDNKVITK